MLRSVLASARPAVACARCSVVASHRAGHRRAAEATHAHWRSTSTRTTKEHQLTSPLSRAPHVLIYGGGSLGLLHAALIQLRCDFERRSRQPTSHSGITPLASSSAGSMTACVISAQGDLVSLLNSTGVEVRLLTDFVRRHRSWIMDDNTDRSKPEPPLLSSQPTDAQHILLPHRVCIPSALSHASSPLPAPTHVLVMVKGRRALERAADELLALFTSHLRQGRSLPTVCILMNGLGHREHLLAHVTERLRDRAATNTPPFLTDAERANILASLESHLYLSTTTSGAKLHKTYASPSPGQHGGAAVPQLQSLRLDHGGMGITTVIANAHDTPQQLGANDSVYRLPHTSLPPPSSPVGVEFESGSSSLVGLFRSLGFETHLASANDSNSILYTKLIVNCAINPLTALHHVRNGALKDDAFTEQVVGITRECVCVMQAMGISVAPHALADACIGAASTLLFPSNFGSYVSIDEFESSRDLRRALFHVYDTITRTAANLSSMVADLHPTTSEPTTSENVQTQRRPRRTEIDAINGHVLACAKTASIATPFNRRVFDQIKQAEAHDT